SLPRTAAAQAASGSHLPIDQLQPGDLLFWSYDGTVAAVHHVALYAGNGHIIEAQQAGAPVHVRPIRLPGTPGAEREVLPFTVRPARAAPPPSPSTPATP
ncbi:MAG: C40 family peptidase, partial [Actinomycetes bacterium]